MKRQLFIVFLLLVCVVFSFAAEDILFADFEGKDYGDWIVKGAAFGSGPAQGTLQGQMKVSGFEDQQLVNTFYNGDETTGTLTSLEFIIERPYIKFLIGGGGYDNETCMNLLIDGKVVRTATGDNTEPGGSEALNPHSWNVSEYQGQTAQIQIADRRSGGWGHINIDHIVQSDTPVQTFHGLSREFKIDHKYLIFPVRNNTPIKKLTLSVERTKVREMNISLASSEPDFWVYLNVREFSDKTVSLRVNDLREKQLEGFFSIRQDDTFPGEEDMYKEKLRPQIHFSSRRGWNNDPNGLMYYVGEYHLFYQHNPYGWPWGNMTWGHAVSTDLVHWEELGDALHPDQFGTMFSGSGVVDWNNTTGFQTGDEPPLICIYTNAGGANEWSKGKPFTQGIAYSNDHGRSWTKYEGNPVQGHLNAGNRDPKVIWWEETKEWVIVLYLKDSRMAFFRSPDLKRWELQSVMDAFHECPELFELPIIGDNQESKWILYGASGDYFLGDFDGSRFIPDGEAIRFNYGNCFYASQTFNNIPEEDGRRIQFGWGRSNVAPGMPFNQMMTFPVVLTLHSTEDGTRMFVYPVREIEKLYTKHYKWENMKIQKDEIVQMQGVSGELFDIDIELKTGKADEIGLIIRGEEIVYNVMKEQLVFGNNVAPLKTVNGCIQLRCIVDRTSLEIFANQGRIYMPCKFRPDEEEKTIGIYARGGEAETLSIQIYELQSIWQ